MNDPLNFIFIEDSNYCNMNCPYCNVWKQRADQPKQLLSADALYRMFSLALERGERCEILHQFTEPLLNYENIKAALSKISLPLINHTLYTNGLLLDKEKIDFLLRRNFNLVMSFDGLHQYFRSKESFEPLLKKIKDFPYCLSISVVMQPLGVDECLRNVDFLLSLPVNQITYKPNTNHKWSSQELKDYYGAIRDHCSEKELDKLGLTKIAISQVNGLTPMANRKNAVYIRSDGMVFQHIQLWDLIPLGYYYEDFESKLQDIYKINYYSEIFNCEECPLKRKCSPNPDPHVIRRIGEGSCKYRKTLYEEMVINGK